MKIIGIILLALGAYFVWRFVIHGDGLVLITPDSGKKVTAVVKRIDPGKELVVEVDNNSKESRITQIVLSRDLVAQLGMSAPAGFKEELLPLTEAEMKDQDSVAFVENYNRENIRWVGTHVVAPDTKGEIIFPITKAADVTGFILFQYEAKWGIGGSISSFRARLGAPEPNKALQGDAQ